MVSTETLKGNKPSWTQKNWNNEGFTVVGYITNFGIVQVNNSTSQIEFACIELGKNSNNTKMQVKIINGEFQVIKSSSRTSSAELCSKGFPYKGDNGYQLELSDVLVMLRLDDNNSVASIMVKNELVKIIMNKINLNRYEKKELKELLKSWRNPIKSQKKIKRTPIIVRKPIKACKR